MKEKLFKKRFLLFSLAITIFLVTVPFIIKFIYQKSVSEFEWAIKHSKLGTVALSFDKEICIDGDIVINFYDAEGNLIFSGSEKINSSGKNFYLHFGKNLSDVKSLEIAKINIKPPFYNITATIFHTLAFLSILAFLFALNIIIKEYNYAGNHILVYAGFRNHYIKINGEKQDEHITDISFTPIILSCDLDEDTHIQATISVSNNITLKINNRLYN